jgi:2-amino-4-hydroxy-6-hydroxymethyldihydropteridine diphosphokinase
MNPPGRDSTAATRATPFILALGSNVGDRVAHLRGGLDFLRRHVTIEAISRVVESAPWGPVPQRDFLNLVARGSTGLTALDLLRIAQEAEAEEGRVREVKWGPRTLDVDLVFFGDLHVQSPRLQIPHPGWAERPFVYRLVPDVAGSMIDPGSGRALAELATDDPLPEGMHVISDLDPPLEPGDTGGGSQ